MEKKIGIEYKNPYDFNEMIYYKYNPIFFEKDLINKIILDHIGQNNKIIEDSGNFVLLTGYLNNYLLQEKESPYNLPLFEIKNALELGQLISFIKISRKDKKQTEDEIQQEIIREKPKKEIKEDAEGEEEPQEEENTD